MSRALQKLEDAAAEDGPQRQVDARERPGRRQRGVDDRIDAPLRLRRRRETSARKKATIGRPQLLALELRSRADAPRTRP